MTQNYPRANFLGNIRFQVWLVSNQRTGKPLNFRWQVHAFFHTSPGRNPYRETLRKSTLIWQSTSEYGLALPKQIIRRMHRFWQHIPRLLKGQFNQKLLLHY
jgi:hypothetical protein